MRIKNVFLGVMAFVMTCAFLSAQEGGITTLTLDFGTSLVSVDSDGVFDSLADAGFDEEESKVTFGYEHEIFGGIASLAFSPGILQYFGGEAAELDFAPPLSIDELYVWVKPFGSYVKFTGGIFENMDGVADYSDDLDLFDMGVFITGDEGGPAEPDELTNPSLSNGLLTDLFFGPVTLQLLLAPNYSKEGTTELFGGLTNSSIDANARFFRLGGRVSADLGAATVSAMFKTYQWPIELLNAGGGQSPGKNVNYMAFGAYADITVIEDLGLSFGYTGYTRANDDSGVDNILFSGIDLRALWTGIEGLSVSTHNNISFAAGAENDWMGELLDGDSFFALFNALGVTKELTEKFSVNAEVANLFSKTGSTPLGEIKYDNFAVGLKLITKVTEHAEFKAGLQCDITNVEDEALTVFSIPIGITLSL
jgi:hypothetical protein